MRRIGTLDTEQHARRFENYLLAIGIKGMVEQTEEGWPVWVYDEDQIDRARAEFDRFVEDPEQKDYLETATAADELRKKEETQNARARKRMIDMRKRWERPLYARCPITFALIAISGAVAFMTQLGSQHEPVENWLVINSYIEQGVQISYHPGLYDVTQRGQVWRLITPIFLHFGIFHLLFNVWMTYVLGPPIEQQRGSRRLLWLVLAIAIPSNVGQYYWSGPTFGGMSGVVYGLFGYIWIKGKVDPAAGLAMPSSTVFWLLAWFLLCMTGRVGPIANVAHAVGLGVGMLAAFLPSQFARK